MLKLMLRKIRSVLKVLRSKTTQRILVHQVEKQLGELGEQLPAELKSGIEAKVEAVKEASQS